MRDGVISWKVQMTRHDRSALPNDKPVERPTCLGTMFDLDEKVGVKGQAGGLHQEAEPHPQPRAGGSHEISPWATLKHQAPNLGRIENGAKLALSKATE